DLALRMNSRRPAFAGLRHPDPGLRIFPQLVPERADRDAQDVRRVRPVAQAVIEGVEDKVTLDVGYRASDERARRRCRGFGRKRTGVAARTRAGDLEPRAVGKTDRFRDNLAPMRKKDGAMDGFFELAHIPFPGMRKQKALGPARQWPERHAVGIRIFA